MNHTLLMAMLLSLPVSLLLLGSVIRLVHNKTVWAFVQLSGAGCLLVVVVVHIFEALQLLSEMGWGLEHSTGHYLDLWSAVLGITLFPLGYLVHTLKKSRTAPGNPVPPRGVK